MPRLEVQKGKQYAYGHSELRAEPGFELWFPTINTCIPSLTSVFPSSSKTLLGHQTLQRQSATRQTYFTLAWKLGCAGGLWLWASSQGTSLNQKSLTWSEWPSLRSLQKTKAREAVENRERFCRVGENVKQPQWKTVWSFLKKPANYRAAIWSINPTPGHVSDNIIIQKDMCTPMFIAALLTIAKTQKQPKRPWQING